MTCFLVQWWFELWHLEIWHLIFYKLYFTNSVKYTHSLSVNECLWKAINVIHLSMLSMQGYPYSRSLAISNILRWPFIIHKSWQYFKDLSLFSSIWSSAKLCPWELVAAFTPHSEVLGESSQKLYNVRVKICLTFAWRVWVWYILHLFLSWHSSLSHSLPHTSSCQPPSLCNFNLSSPIPLPPFLSLHSLQYSRTSSSFSSGLSSPSLCPTYSKPHLEQRFILSHIQGMIQIPEYRINSRSHTSISLHYCFPSSSLMMVARCHFWVDIDILSFLILFSKYIPPFSTCQTFLLTGCFWNHSAAAQCQQYLAVLLHCSADFQDVPKHLFWAKFRQN